MVRQSNRAQKYATVLATMCDDHTYKQLIALDNIDLEKQLRLHGLNGRYLQEYCKDKYTAKIGGLIDNESGKFYSYPELELSHIGFERMHPDE